MAGKIIENQCVEVRANEKDVANIKTQTIGILKTLFPEESLSNMTTEELARAFRVQSNTIRRSYCVNGHYQGLIPIKMPNG